MIKQTQHITREIRIEVYENGDIILIKSNQEIVLSATDIVNLVNSDLETTIDNLFYNIEVIKNTCEYSV